MTVLINAVEMKSDKRHDIVTSVVSASRSILSFSCLSVSTTVSCQDCHSEFELITPPDGDTVVHANFASFPRKRQTLGRFSADFQLSN